MVIKSPTICDSNGNYYHRATSRFASEITVCRRLDLDGMERKSASEDSARDVRVASQMFEDEYRKQKVMLDVI